MAEEVSTEEFCARFHFLYCAPVLTFIGSKTKSECMFKDEFIEQSWKKENNCSPLLFQKSPSYKTFSMIIPFCLFFLRFCVFKLLPAISSKTLASPRVPLNHHASLATLNHTSLCNRWILISLYFIIYYYFLFFYYDFSSHPSQPPCFPWYTQPHISL